MPIMKELIGLTNDYGFSNALIATECNVTEETVAMWMRGSVHPSPTSLEKWAHALGSELTLCPLIHVSKRIIYNTNNRSVFVGGVPYPLSALQLKALDLLSVNLGELVPNRKLWQHLYSDEPYRPNSSKMRSLISRIRHVVPRIQIKGESGRGYILSQVVIEGGCIQRRSRTRDGPGGKWQRPIKR